MDVKSLFCGIAVIIDDEIDDSGSTINQIKNILAESNIPVLPFNHIPSEEIIPSLSSASLIILDWDYFHENIDNEDAGEIGSRIIKPAELGEEEEARLISFIRKLLKSVFAPVFIFTSKSIDDIRSKLIDKSLYFKDKPNRLFIKSKSDVSNKDALFSTINDWLTNTPSAYVFKEWDRLLTKSKNEMFVELYGLSTNWVGVIWDMLKKDSRENQNEFGDFITKQLVNRITEYGFEEGILSRSSGVTIEELMKVVQGERYISLCPPQKEAHTGDLFLDGDKYYLNIRAQCDLSRKDNPDLYLITGKVLNETDIELDDIRLTNDGIFHLNKKKRYSLAQIGEICNNNEQLIAFNSLLSEYRNTAFFSSGNIIGKKSDIIIMCIDSKTAIKFRLDISIKKYNAIKEKLIGRLLPPYITSVQQACSSYITREGTLPTPKGIFKQEI